MNHNITPNAFAKLRRNNIIVSFLYFLVGTFILVGTLTIEAAKEYQPSLWVSFIERVQRTTGSSPRPFYLRNALAEFLEKIPFMLIIVSVFFIAALIHLLIATKGVNQKYNNQMQHGINKLRWIDSIFSSVILAVIPIFMGINNVSIIILLFGLGIVFNILAIAMETPLKFTSKTHWSPFIGMVLIYIASLASLLLPFLKQKELEQLSGLTEPLINDFNYIIIVMYFAFWFIKLIHTFLQHKKVGGWKSPVFVENGYMVINFLFRVAVVGTIFYGVVNGLFSTLYTNL